MGMLVRPTFSSRLGLWIAATIICLPSLAQAAAHATWQQSRTLLVPLTNQTVYGSLAPRAGGMFFRFSITKPESFHVRLSQPLNTSKAFEPRFVLYEPDDLTMGPYLPMDQPPQTLATVYPMSESVIHFYPATITSSVAKFETDFQLQRPGRYYLAVYNAGGASGRVRLDFGQMQLTWVSILTWPWHFVQDQAWSGFSLVSLFIPFWLLALTVWSWLALAHQKTHHRLHRKK